MRNVLHAIALATAFAVLSGFAPVASADRDDDRGRDDSIQLGPRPFYLVDGMDEGPLKQKLMQCKDGPFRRTDFSIAHRGAALQFPEHTKEAYQAGARMGAGIVECDVTFTRDGHLVCRHAENDLHTTTNILLTPLAATCIKPFTPATLDANGKVLTPASAECRTSDADARRVQEPEGQDGRVQSGCDAQSRSSWAAPPSWRTDLYTGRGTLMTLRESIELNERNGVKHTPELKGGDAGAIAKVFGSQESYAQKIADDAAGRGRRSRTMRGRSRST